MRLMIGPPYRGTRVGRCIVERYAAVDVGPFAGNPAAINYVFRSIKY
jgi:hypothetical protein